VKSHAKPSIFINFGDINLNAKTFVQKNCHSGAYTGMHTIALPVLATVKLKITTNYECVKQTYLHCVIARVNVEYEAIQSKVTSANSGPHLYH
jgi:hypothetical protein